MAEGTWALDLTCRLLQFWFKDVLTWFLIAIGSDHADLDLHCFHLPVLGTAAGNKGGRESHNCREGVQQ